MSSFCSYITTTKVNNMKLAHNIQLNTYNMNVCVCFSRKVLFLVVCICRSTGLPRCSFCMRAREFVWIWRSNDKPNCILFTVFAVYKSKWMLFDCFIHEFIWVRITLSICLYFPYRNAWKKIWWKNTIALSHIFMFINAFDIMHKSAKYI